MSSPRQHTPGPWTASTPDYESMPANRCWGCDIAVHAASGFYGVAGPGVVTLATVFDSEANARLIASAPELLAALEATEAKLTQAARAFYGAGSAKALREAFEGWRTTAEAARAAIARATGGNAL